MGLRDLCVWKLLILGVQHVPCCYFTAFGRPPVSASIKILLCCIVGGFFSFVCMCRCMP